MPAGNDQEAALAELADQFGEGVGRAEGLIEASRQRYQGDLSRAQLEVRDEDATAELDLGEVAKTAGVKKAEIVDAAVRGRFVTYVAVDEDGRTHKGAFASDALGKSPKTAEKAAEGEDKD